MQQNCRALGYGEKKEIEPDNTTNRREMSITIYNQELLDFLINLCEVVSKHLSLSQVKEDDKYNQP